MIEDKELQALVGFTGEGKVLSVYLNTDLAHQSKDAIKLMLRQRTRNLSKSAANEVQTVEKFLDFEYDWESRGLAIFVSGQELWKAIPLPIPVTTQVFLSERPYVLILSDVLDRFGKYTVALIDNENIRLFEVSWGRVESVTEGLGEEIKRHRQGGKAAQRIQHHTENTALRNLRQAVELIQTFGQETGSTRLMLGGSPEVLSQIKEFMPKHMRSQIIGEFTIDMDASPSEILSYSLDIAAQADQQEEQQSVSDVITAASKGGAGVIGLADTLYTLYQGRVHRLLVEENYHAAGYVCGHCGHVSAQQSAKCVLCAWEEVRETPDAVNLAIQKAIETGAAVHIVRQNEELAKAGGIAAALRY